MFAPDHCDRTMYDMLWKHDTEQIGSRARSAPESDGSSCVVSGDDMNVDAEVAQDYGKNY